LTVGFFSRHEKSTAARGATGRRGEELAAAFLRQQGYTLVERNFRLRSGEIDIIARDRETLVFVEVKTRSCSRFGTPFDAVDGRKQQQIGQTALAYLAARGMADCAVRFDVVAVYLDDGEPRIELLKNAFEYPGG